jgi:hypothetical protein
MGHVTALKDKHKANQKQDEEAENLKIRILVYEIGYFSDKGNHDSHGNDHRPHHHQEDVGHPDDGENGVDGEEQIHGNDYKKHLPESGSRFDFFLDPFYLVPQFLDTFPDEEKTASHEDDGFAGKSTGYCQAEWQNSVEMEKDACGISQYGTHHKEKQDAKKHGQDKSPVNGFFSLIHRQIIGKNGDYDKIVGTKRYLEKGHGKKIHPEYRLENCIEHCRRSVNCVVSNMEEL